MRVIKHKGLELASTKNMDRATWLALRSEWGVGGSDVSAVLRPGLNKYFSATELFYQKLGLTGSKSSHDRATLWGTELEPSVLKFGQFYDLESEDYISNYENGEIKRVIKPFKYMVRNPQYPQLFANIDGAINPLGKLKFEGIAEAKTVSRQQAEIWDGRIAPYHIAQVQSYMLVLKPIVTSGYAIIFYLEDGRELYARLIKESESFQSKIDEDSRFFWDKVKKGREIIAEVTDPERRDFFLSQIEPEPDHTKAYEDFISEKYAKKLSYQTVTGSDELLTIATQYDVLGREISALETSRQTERNKIIKFLNDNSANVVEMGRSKITYANKRLYVNIKD